MIGVATPVARSSTANSASAMELCQFCTRRRFPPGSTCAQSCSVTPAAESSGPTASATPPPAGTRVATALLLVK